MRHLLPLLTGLPSALPCIYGVVRLLLCIRSRWAVHRQQYPPGRTKNEDNDENNRDPNQSRFQQMKLGGCVYIQALVRVNEVNDDVMQYVEDARTGNMRLFGCRRSPSLSSRAVIEKSCLGTDRALTQNNISYPAGWLTPKRR